MVSGTMTYYLSSGYNLEKSPHWFEYESNTIILKREGVLERIKNKILSWVRSWKRSVKSFWVRIW